jgi:negative regulator of sigma E activity
MQKSQAELRGELDKIRKMVHDAEMDSTWVKWETLRNYSLNDIVNKIGLES